MADKAIFLDRDDTLIEDHGYINNPDQVKLLDGVAEALRELKEMGYKLIVASNQSAVARGIVTEEVLGEIHDRLKQLLAEKGAFLDQIYYCPYHPDGVIPKYRKESDWRKPNPGMLLAAASEMNIDISQSWCIGNSSRDVEAGLRAGCKTILIDHSPYPKQSEPHEPAPDYRAVNIKEAVNIIKRYHRYFGEAATRVESSPINQTELASNATETVLQTAEPIVQTAEPTSEADEPVLQVVEEPPEPELTEPQPVPAEQETPADKTIQLLEAILGQLKKMQRAEMFVGEFSITRLMAGIVQIVVLFCLLVTIWFLMSPTRQDNSVLIALGFATVLQMMALTLYIMQGRK
ncbi:MAG: HAD family hydrolase [Planctomycetota bacterium]|nr:HAD family hydrolase [Planctomycetota bacterium]